ncbi:hypothetical protein HRbin22_00613 [Candidatus Thermoflexus japonica]|uniref:Cobalamin adenosyltransferase-like domain-containing protein n=1 Tax=Candidatus Thermoflexus japonica TaxID=2035417 RepID=A0A2H5Y4L0_9CHLR|nr:hypothetical protein HRbin22_00613 [Candidatus Thermoflexus japonica]
MSLYQPEDKPRGSEGYQALHGWMAPPASSLSSAPLLELNAWLGIARAPAHSARVQAVLRVLQMDLQRMIEQSDASPTWDLATFVTERVRWLEQTRETMEHERRSRGSPELPGDTVTGAILDLLSVMTWRMQHGLHQEEAQADPAIQEYLERLPALLFTLARYEEDQADPYR